jgi:hypothetical protein
VKGEARAVDPGRLVEVVVHVDLDHLEAVTSVHSNSWRFMRNLPSSPGTRMAQ